MLGAVGAYVRRHHLGLLALFIALSGTSYAATIPRNTVGTKQIKKRAVTSSKIRSAAITRSKLRNRAVNGVKVADGSLTGADVNEASLGPVPRATDAGRAASAAAADSAGNASRLSGLGASAFARAPACPAGTVFHEAACIERARRPGNGTWIQAHQTCTDEGRRLPSVAELSTARLRGLQSLHEAEWTHALSSGGGDPTIYAQHVIPQDVATGLVNRTSTLRYRCVASVP